MDKSKNVCCHRHICLAMCSSAEGRERVRKPLLYVEGNFKVISRRAFRLLELIRKYGFDKVRVEIRTALADGDEPDLHGLISMKRLRKAGFTFEEVCRAVAAQAQWEDEIRARDSKLH